VHELQRLKDESHKPSFLKFNDENKRGMLPEVEKSMYDIASGQLVGSDEGRPRPGCGLAITR
jgi:hypothetical protein